jgi:hypothetical protein
LAPFGRLAGLVHMPNPEFNKRSTNPSQELKMKSAKNVYGWMAVTAVVFGLAMPTKPAAAQATKANSAEPGEVVVSVSDAYIPSGFDSGSEAFVVVNGLFPNTCYSWKEARIAHVRDTEHEIRAVAVVKPGICMMMLVPFQHEVQLGRLARGTHTLKFVSGDGTYVQKQMIVE